MTKKEQEGEGGGGEEEEEDNVKLFLLCSAHRNLFTCLCLKIT